MVFACAFFGTLSSIIWFLKTPQNPVSFLLIFQVVAAIVLLIALIREIKKGVKIYKMNKMNESK